MQWDFIPKHCLIRTEFFFQLIKFMNIIQEKYLDWVGEKHSRWILHHQNWILIFCRSLQIYSSLKDCYPEVIVLYSTHILLCKMHEYRQRDFLSCNNFFDVCFVIKPINKSLSSFWHSNDISNIINDFLAFFNSWKTLDCMNLLASFFIKVCMWSKILHTKDSSLCRNSLKLVKVTILDWKKRIYNFVIGSLYDSTRRLNRLSCKPSDRK